MSRKLSLLSNILRGKFLPFLLPFWDGREQNVVKEWLAGQRYLGAVEELEHTLTARYGQDVTVKSINLGRSALQVALQSMQLKPNSEVILPSFGCSGTIMPIIQAGLTPVLVDCDNHFNIRLESIQEASSGKLRVILMPHLSGLWANDAENILQWAKTKNIYVIEDCAQSLDLYYNEQPAGTLGDIGIFSCNGGKQIMNSGGAWIITRNKEFGEFIKSAKFQIEPDSLINHRITEFYKRYRSSQFFSGFTYLTEAAKMKFLKKLYSRVRLEDYSFKIFPLCEIEATLILMQLNKIGEITRKRKQHAAFWRQRLETMGLNSVRFLPEERNLATKMLLSFEGVDAEQESAFLRSTLTSNGIETEGSYVPLHLRKPFTEFRSSKMPFTERLWKNAFSVPVRPNLEANDLERIQTVTSAVGGA